MAEQFSPQTLADVRRRVGRLMHGPKFLYGTALSGSATSIELEQAKRFPDDFFIGSGVYTVSGTGSGQHRVVSDSTQLTGSLTVATWGTTPDSTTVVEVYPGDMRPDQINDAIVLAVRDAAKVFLRRTDWTVAQASFAADRKSFPLDAAVKKVFEVVYQQPDGYWVRLTPVPRLDDLRWQLQPASVAFLGATGYVDQPIPGGVTELKVRGYQYPTEPAADSDTIYVDPTFLVYMAAFYLEAGDVGGQMIDPEQHAGRAGNWLTQALRLRGEMMNRWEPGTLEVS